MCEESVFVERGERERREMTKRTRGKSVKCMFNCAVRTMSPQNQMHEAQMNSAHDTTLIQIHFLYEYNQLGNTTMAKQLVYTDYPITREK